MEFIILGLLALRERTLYEINKILERNISLFYSASLGSIGSALSKLRAQGLVEVREVVERGRNKKLFAITPAGAEAFQTWLRSPIPSERVREPALARLFFLGHLPAAERIAVIEAHLAALEALLATLELLERQAVEAAIPDESGEIVAYQRLTLRYGRDYYTFSSAWYRRLLEELKAPTS